MKPSEGVRLGPRDYLQAAVGVLPPGARRRLVRMVAVLAGLAMLDLLALFIVLGLTTIAAAGPSADLPAPLDAVLPVLGLESGRSAATALGIAAVVLFVGKAVLATITLRWALRSLARDEAALTTKVVADLMKAPLSFHTGRRYVDTMTDSTVGAESLIMRGVAPLVLIAAELVLVVVIALGLIVLAPLVALITTVYFVAVLAVLNRAIGTRTARAGEADVAATRAGMILIQWAIGGFREVVARGAEPFFEQKISEVRGAGARSRADAAYLQLVPRYFLETSLIVGLVIVYTAQLPFVGSTRALSGLVLFAVAGFRLLPSLQRLQASAATIRGAQPFGERCLRLLDELAAIAPTSTRDDRAIHSQVSHPLHTGVRLHQVTYTYAGAARAALLDVNLLCPAGRTTALVGASGSGKTTALDVILGLLPAQAGLVTVDELPLDSCLASWRASVGYVPQAVFLMPVTVRENIALGVDPEAVNDDDVWHVLEQAQLADVVRALPYGLDQPLGDAGGGLSGGQRQRLGIARALFTGPTSLLLDEATSALDVDTEAEITATLSALDSSLTKIIVAHRLSTVKDADHVAFFQAGSVLAQGTFDEVAAAVPDFARQIILSGLSVGS